MNHRSNVVLDLELLQYCREILKPLGFVRYYRIDWVSGAGSGRVFYRLRVSKTHSVILMLWSRGDTDWDIFLALHDVPNISNFIPRLIHCDRENSRCIVGDGGERPLRDLLFSLPTECERKELLNLVAVKLAHWQTLSIPEQSPLHKRQFTEADCLWETDYFRTHLTSLVPALAHVFTSPEWESTRQKLADSVGKLPLVLMHRDFQSENIVFSENQVQFVDIQGVRFGPAGYDVASLLFDPYVYPLMTAELRASFVQSFEEAGGMAESLLLCALQRIMQIVGAYGNLSLNNGKRRYLQFVRPALLSLFTVAEIDGTFPIISDIASEALFLIKDEKWASIQK